MPCSLSNSVSYRKEKEKYSNRVFLFQLLNNNRILIIFLQKDRAAGLAEMKAETCSDMN